MKKLKVLYRHSSAAHSQIITYIFQNLALCTLFVKRNHCDVMYVPMAGFWRQKRWGRKATRKDVIADA